MTAVDLARLGFAAYRLGRLVAVDEISAPIRDRLDDRLGEDSKLAYLAACPFCVSVWAAAGLVAVDRGRGRRLVDVLAVAGVASLATAVDGG